MLSSQLIMKDVDFDILILYNEKCDDMIKQCELKCSKLNRFQAFKLRKKTRKEMDLLCEQMLGKEFDNNRKIVAEKTMMIVNAEYLNENIGKISGNGGKIKNFLKTDEEIIDLLSDEQTISRK